MVWYQISKYFREVVCPSSKISIMKTADYSIFRKNVPHVEYFKLCQFINLLIINYLKFWHVVGNVLSKFKQTKN